jgi:hypothetical protein
MAADPPATLVKVPPVDPDEKDTLTFVAQYTIPVKRFPAVLGDGRVSVRPPVEALLT